MSCEWKEYKLGDLYETSSGLSKSKDEFGFGYPFVAFKDVFKNYFLPDELSSFANTTVAERMRCSVKKGDIFLTRTSETSNELGMSCVALKDYPNATFNGFTKRLRLKDSIDIEIDPLYMGYYLRNNKFRKSISAYSSLTTRASLNNSAINALQVSIPNIRIQKKIGEILKSLDNQIATNTKINQTLETIAQTLFKSWFVDFDPVKAKIAAKEQGEDPQLAAMIAISGKTAEQIAQLTADKRNELAATVDLFPDEMVESELGMIPRGWKVKPLDKVADFLNGLALQKYPAKEDEEYLPVIKIAQLKKGDSVGAEKASLKVPKEYVIGNGDIIFSWSGSLYVDIWSGGKGALNQHLFKVSSNEYPKWFYYQWVNYHLPEFQRIAADKAVTMGHIKREHLTQALCVVPNDTFLKRSHFTFLNLLDKSIQCKLESSKLTEIRDSLLPKLLSGEIDIQ